MRRYLPGLLLVAASGSACTAQALPDGPGWTAVHEAVPSTSTDAAPAEQQSLGSRFLVAAERNVPPAAADPASAGGELDAPSVGDSGVVLASDACDVTLASLQLDVQPAPRTRAAAFPALRLRSSGPVVGLVLASAPHSLHAVFAVTLRAEVSAGDGPAAVASEPAWVTVDAAEMDESVLTAVHVELGDGALSQLWGGGDLEFTAWGGFAADDQDVPAHRWECW